MNLLEIISKTKTLNNIVNNEYKIKKRINYYTLVIYSFSLYNEFTI